MPRRSAASRSATRWDACPAAGDSGEIRAASGPVCAQHQVVPGRGGALTAAGHHVTEIAASDTGCTGRGDREPEPGRSFKQFSPGRYALAAPCRAFPDEFPLGIPNDISQRGADLAEPRHALACAFEIGDEVRIPSGGASSAAFL